MCYEDRVAGGEWCRRHTPFQSNATDVTRATLEWERDYLKREVELLQEENMRLWAELKVTRSRETVA